MSLNVTRASCIPFFGLIAILVWISGTVALAQAPAPELPRIKTAADPKIGVQASSPATRGLAAPSNAEARAAAVQPIPLEQVPDRAQAPSAELDTILPEEASRQTLERIDSELDRTLPEVESILATARGALAARPYIHIVQDHAAEVGEMLERLQPWDEELDRQLAELRASLRDEWQTGGPQHFLDKLQEGGAIRARAGAPARLSARAVRCARPRCACAPRPRPRLGGGRLQPAARQGGLRVSVGLWAALVLGELGLLGHAATGVGRVLGAGVSVGTLSV